MNPAYLGDSYDVVKRFFCESARTAGYTVYVDPMFTGDWSARQRAMFLKFLGAHELGAPSPQSPAALLVDPDTGIRSTPGRSHATFGSIAENCERCALVIVFDQSFSRGIDARSALTAKLTKLRTFGVAFQK